MGKVYTTDDVEGRRAFEYWSDLVCDVYVGLDCDSDHRNQFKASIRCSDLPNMRLSTITGSGHFASRSKARIARSPCDDVLVNLQVAGSTSLAQGGRRVQLHPGDLVFYDASREFEILADSGFRTIVFQIGRDRLRLLSSEIDGGIARAFAGQFGFGRLASRFLAEVPGVVENSPDEIHLVENSTIDMLQMAFGSIVPPKETSATAHRTAQLLWAKQIVEERLHNSDFDRARLAKALGMSVRELSRLFATEDITPSGYIHIRRLEGCRRALREPRWASSTVTDIAFAHGFSDSAHFSCAFRKNYGLSPREYKALRDNRDDIEPMTNYRTTPKRRAESSASVAGAKTS